MKKFLLTILLFMSPAVLWAQEDIQKVSLPTEVKQEMKVSVTDPAIEGKVWNRWTSKNFVSRIIPIYDCILMDAEFKISL